MNCPRCNKEVLSDMTYCPQCGLLLQNQVQPQVSNAPQQAVASKPTRERLIGNGIYAIFMFCCTFNYAIAFFPVLFVGLNEDFLFAAIYGIVALLFGGYCLIQGILLWKRNIIGLILAIVHNVLHVLSGIICCMFGTYMTYAGIVGTGDYDVLGLFFGIPSLAIGLAMLVFGIIFLVYYILKRKHFKQ